MRAMVRRCLVHRHHHGLVVLVVLLVVVVVLLVLMVMLGLKLRRHRRHWRHGALHRVLLLHGVLLLLQCVLLLLHHVVLLLALLGLHAGDLGGDEVADEAHVELVAWWGKDGGWVPMQPSDTSCRPDKVL